MRKPATEIGPRMLPGSVLSPGSAVHMLCGGAEPRMPPPEAAARGPVRGEVEGEPMPRVLISCSGCERPVYTGLTFEQWFTFDWVDVQGATTTCNACGAANAWTKDDAYLEADGGGD